MPELIAKANQVIMETRWLRREGRSLRFEAAVLASELGATIIRSQMAQNELAKTSGMEIPRGRGAATLP